jgi:protein gp37
MGAENYKNGFTVTLQPHMLSKPLQWKRPRKIFVNSMSDLFHEEVPLEYIQQVFRICEQAHWHTFQVLTKRAERLHQLVPALSWPTNLWIGVTVENADTVSRIAALRGIPAPVRFLSIEPLLGPLPELDLEGIAWVIVGGESGPHARPMQADWVRDIRDQCVTRVASTGFQTAFFFKQWGGVEKRKNGKELDGRTWEEMPF